MTKIYLISPPKINLDNFVIDLEVALKTNKVPVFQLRLKNISDQEVLEIGKKLLKICHQNNTLFILNDREDLALQIGADGVHLGSDDCNVLKARKMVPENFIIGASCYDSKHLAAQAAEDGANYVAFGTFFPSKTKNSAGKPTPEIIKWCNEILNVGSVAIGGINANNCHEIALAEPDFVSIISYVWDNENGIKSAIEQLFSSLKVS